MREYIAILGLFFAGYAASSFVSHWLERKRSERLSESFDKASKGMDQY